MHMALKTILLIILMIPNYILAESLDGKKTQQFIDHMLSEYNFDAAELQQLFSQAQYSSKVIQSISRPAEKLPWYKYQKIFLQQARIKEGVEFWKKHQAILQKAQEIYGVPAEIIVAIIGIETRYGKNTGKYRVIDALSTLAFHFPKRAEFFRKELVQFLLLTTQQEIDPLSVKGSYAGAMGVPQFISSSYRHYAIDFDGDGKKDLWDSPMDVIGSVANYFKQHNWQVGEPIVFPIGNAKEDDLFGIIDNGLKPDMQIKDLQKYGIVLDHKLANTVPIKIMRFEQQVTNEYWIGMQNFYVITRYNHSALYAMAVYQLSQSISIGYNQ